MLARRDFVLAQRQHDAARAAQRGPQAALDAAARAVADTRRRVEASRAAGARMLAEQRPDVQRLAADEAAAHQRTEAARQQLAALAPAAAQARRESDAAFDAMEGLRRGTSQWEEANRAYGAAARRSVTLDGEIYSLREQARQHETEAEHAHTERARLVEQQVEHVVAAHPDLQAATTAHEGARNAEDAAFQRTRSAQTRFEQASQRLRRAERAASPTSARNAQRQPAAVLYGDMNAQNEVHGVFGYELTPRDISLLAGAGAGDRVIVSSNARAGSGVEVRVRGPNISREFEVAKEHGLVVVHDHITRNLGEKTGSSGRDVISGFDAMRYVGVDLLRAEAARGATFNGYYTWARLGFTGDIPHGILYAAQREFGPGVTRVEDLMHERGGAQWWKQHGDSWDATFDFRPGSYSMRVLDRFKRALH